MVRVDELLKENTVGSSTSCAAYPMCKRGAFTVDGKNTQFTLWRVLSCLKNPFSFKQIRMTVNHKKLYTEQKEWIFFSTTNPITEY